MIEVLRDKYGKGVCISCGYLGKRSRDIDNPECYEVSVHERETGVLAACHGWSSMPKCFVNEFDLLQETKFGQDGNPTPESLATTMSKQRKCPAWYTYREFAGPKELWNESMMLAMEQRREKFERDLEQERQSFEQRLSAISQSVQEDSKKTSDRIHFLTWWWQRSESEPVQRSEIEPPRVVL